MSTTLFTYYDPNKGMTGWTAPMEGSYGQAKVRPSMTGRNFVSGANLGATPVVVDMMGAAVPCSVWAKPAAGNTILVEYAVENTAVDNPAAATWFPWPSGTVSTATMEILDAPVTALRFTRAAGIGTTNAYGVVI